MYMKLQSLKLYHLWLILLFNANKTIIQNSDLNWKESIQLSSSISALLKVIPCIIFKDLIHVIAGGGIFWGHA